MAICWDSMQWEREGRSYNNSDVRTPRERQKSIVRVTWAFNRTHKTWRWGRNPSHCVALIMVRHMVRDRRRYNNVGPSN